MRTHNRKWNIMGRKIIVLLLLCGLLMPILQQTQAVTATYTYTWIKDTSGLPTDDQWHDYFIAWEDHNDKNKVWFTDYHWYTADGRNNYDAGGTHWMEYKAASTLPVNNAASFTSQDCLGHMQIRYAGRDGDNDNSPKYYIRVSKMNGGYVYFTSYEPTEKESSADAFTFQDKGDVFHIFVNASGKADRYLTINGQYMETTESSSYGGGESWRPMRVYQRTFVVNEEVEIPDVIGKTTLYEYFWVNTVDEILALANTSDWTDIVLAWEDADGYGTTNPDKVWYTKEIWYDQSGAPNYKNGSAAEATTNDFFYWSNDYWGTDGYSSPYGESFLLPSQVSHFQVKMVGWDGDNPIHGYTFGDEQTQKSPKFNFRFSIGRGRYIYIGNNGFYEEAKHAEDYTVQLRLGQKDEEDLYGSVWIINNISWDQDELITRKKNRFDVSNWIPSKYWEFPFRIYTYRPVECDAIVKSFSVGRGATYSIDRQLIIEKDVTITVEDGGVLTVDDHLLNNGKIVVKNGGTVIVNEGGYIMAYDGDSIGSITLDGGNLIIMDGAKVICDQNGGTLQADNGTTILNRGMLMVGDSLIMSHNSCLKNESGAMLLLGGRIGQERGSVGAFSFDELSARVKNEEFTSMLSTGSMIINQGTISQPADSLIINVDNLISSTKTVNGGTTRTR